MPQGAATTVYAATAAALDAHGGAYLEDCAIAERNDAEGSRGGIRSYAIDPDRAEALWTRTEEWIARSEQS